jgi:hypothetical protein
MFRILAPIMLENIKAELCSIFKLKPPTLIEALAVRFKLNDRWEVAESLRLESKEL